MRIKEFQERISTMTIVELLSLRDECAKKCRIESSGEDITDKVMESINTVINMKVHEYELREAFGDSISSVEFNFIEGEK